MIKRLCLALLALILHGAAADAATEVRVTFLLQQRAAAPVLSNLDPLPDDIGLAGARLGTADNATTGRFLGHAYSLETAVIGASEDPRPAARAALERGGLLVLDMPPEALLAVADLPEARGALLINAGSEAMALREQDCRANLLHTAPSLAMRADALMQFVRERRWDDLAMITGPHPADLAFAEALRASAAKFGLKIGAQKAWLIDADMRRNASQEVPLFTQDLGDYDLLLIADETGDFGRYVAYNTWRARPVAGSEGLVPTAWSRVVEQWGAAQLQSRFRDLAGRDMAPRDYAAWAALRSIGEAVTRTGRADAEAVRAYLLSDAFELAGFKGRAMDFRAWNGQLRQPIPLVTERAVVAQAPLPGYLHQVTELDTLGIDGPESRCEAFR